MTDTRDRLFKEWIASWAEETGQGVPCAEAQADGVPCFELDRDCSAGRCSRFIAVRPGSRRVPHVPGTP